MPSSVAAVFAAARIEVEGVVRWGERVTDESSGVYVVALTDKLDSLDGTLPSAPISRPAIEELLAVRPELTLDGRRPSVAELAARIAAFWLPDEPTSTSASPRRCARGWAPSAARGSALAEKEQRADRRSP